MDAANEEDDRIIAKMEKKLGLKKKKKLPSSFDEDGLGCILFSYFFKDPPLRPFGFFCCNFHLLVLLVQSYSYSNF